MLQMEAAVWELLAAAQAARKAQLDAGRVNKVFKVGDLVLLRTKELLDAADIGKLQPRWDSPFSVPACPSPNSYTLALPRHMLHSLTVNVDRLRPYFEYAGRFLPSSRCWTLGRRASMRWSCCCSIGGVTGLPCLVWWQSHSSADN
jgi:hypothetical protein